MEFGAPLRDSREVADDGSRFLAELASHTANLSACSEVEREYLRVRAKILDQQRCLEGWFHNMIVNKNGVPEPMPMMNPPQHVVPGSSRSHKYKYSAASSGTHTPSTCSGSSDLSRPSDGGAPGLTNWEPSEQERQFLLEQIQEALLTRNAQPVMPMMPFPAPQPNLSNQQSTRTPMSNECGASAGFLGSQTPQNMQPQKIPVMGSHPNGGLQGMQPVNSKFPYVSPDNFPPPVPSDQPMMASPVNPAMFLSQNRGPHGGTAPLAPGSLEHMQMLSKIAELQQQLNEQQKLLEAATQGSGCPSIQAGVKDLHTGPMAHQGKNKGPGGYPRGPAMPMPGAMPDSCVVGPPKNRGGTNMAKDNKNGKAPSDTQLANSATLQTHLKALGDEDPQCIFIVRKVNRLGFRSVEVLTKFFGQHGTVVKVLVAHSKVKRNQPGNSELYLRPGSLGFVLMKNQESVHRILTGGPTITVQGTPIRVQAFSRLNNGMLEKTDEDGDAGDEASTVPETSTDAGDGW